LAHFNAAILSSLNNASDRHFVYAFSGESGNNISHANSFLSSFVAIHTYTIKNETDITRSIPKAYLDLHNT